MVMPQSEKSAPSWLRIAFWSSLIVPVLLIIWGAWFGRFPLGVPGEWEWNRIDFVGSLAATLAPPLVCALLYVGFVRLGGRCIARSPAAESAAWLGGLALFGFAWLWVAQESAPATYQLSKAAWVLYFRGSSGYFSEAREGAGDLPAYLAAYESKMGEGDVLHLGTHPPGLVIIFRALVGLCDSFPPLVDALVATEPDSVAASFDELAHHNPLTRADRAVLWLAALLVQAGAALTVVPLYGLVRHGQSRRASWLAASFWPTIPALPIFLPKADCLYPLLACGFLWLWLAGRARESRVMSFLAGSLLWLGMMLSLAFLPIAFFAALATPRPRLAARLVAWAAAGFLLPTLAVGVALKLNMAAIWWLNFRNHAGFYGQFPRTMWKWLLVNPIEFAVAAGAPLAVVAAWSIARQLCSRDERPRRHVWAALATIGLLWLSGKNTGETARLWIILMPFLMWIAGPLFESPAPRALEIQGPAAEPSRMLEATWLGHSGWAAALALQLATTTALAMRVVGFHYP
jgi:hypothetical protein